VRVRDETLDWGKGTRISKQICLLLCANSTTERLVRYEAEMCNYDY